MSPSLNPQSAAMGAYETIPSGGAGLVYSLRDSDPDLRLFGNYSRGFRLNPPVFGVTQTAEGVHVPSPLLAPVTADSYELGIRNSGRYMFGSFCGYYTNFNHFQSYEPGTFNGKSWFDFNGSGIQEPDDNVFVLTDTGKASMYGVEWQEDFRIDQLVNAPGRLWLGGASRTCSARTRPTRPLIFPFPLGASPRYAGSKAICGKANL